MPSTRERHQQSILTVAGAECFAHTMHIRKLAQRTALATLTTALIAGPLTALAPNAYAGTEEEITCPEGEAPPTCLPAIEFDRNLNVTALRFTVAHRATVYITITLENGDGLGRNERTVTITNTLDDLQEMTWTVPTYAQSMDMRIIRAEFHTAR